MVSSDDEYERLADMVGALSEVGSRMRDRDRQFIEDQAKRLNDEGSNVHMSPAQWRWIEDLYRRWISGD